MSVNENLGHYSVGAATFKNKLAAIAEANKTLADVQWHFNDEAFNRADWTKEPDTSLPDLYRIRAQQIREAYDYVIVMFSGGADSVNMLYSFLDNGIRVDEVIAGAPLSGLKNWEIDKKDKSASNMISETWLAQLPRLNEVVKNHPGLKVTMHDYFEDMLGLTDEWIYNQTGHWIHYSSTARHSLEKFTHLKNLAEQGKRIGVVYGIDKPQLCRGESGSIYSVVFDSTVNIVTPHFKARYPNVDSVLFYYSADLPELMIKQAHQVCRVMFSGHSQQARNNLWDRSKDDAFNLNPNRISGWERAISSIIYGSVVNTHGMLWQASKQQLGFKGGFEIDGWMYKLHSTSRIVELVESELKRFVKPLHRKYMASDDVMNGFVRYSKYWKIGHESQWFQHSP